MFNIHAFLFAHFFLDLYFADCCRLSRNMEMKKRSCTTHTRSKKKKRNLVLLNRLLMQQVGFNMKY